jgi:NADPH-dependent glutamate synthase beta subunit-like oxidoreductase
MSEVYPTSETELEQQLEPFGLSIDAVRELETDLEWVALFRRGRLTEAYARLRQESPLPEMTSHIRADPGAEDRITLRRLQYMIAWIERDRGLTGVSVPAEATGRRVAVVGGGPAGLAATVRLLEQGHCVALFEREMKLGGAPALVYPEERLPDPQDEIDALLQPALDADRLTITLGADVSPDALLGTHDAVLMATGCWNEQSLGTADNVWPALRFLKEAREGRCDRVPRTVTILCGGDAAMDAAIVAKKLGAETLNLLFESTRAKAHWHLPDSWFDLQGVEARFEVHPTGYRVDAGGAVDGVELEGEDTVETELVIEAMGLYGDEIDTQPDGLFAAGALVNGGASVQQCVQEAFEAAHQIDRHLQGPAS